MTAGRLLSTQSIEEYGAVRHGRAALSFVDRLVDAVSALPTGRAGVRIVGRPAITGLLGSDSEIGSLAAAHIGRRANPVRAVLFDKGRDLNWSLAWHQDRTIAVRAKVNTPGYGPWTVKAGITHVEPPFSIIEQMVTLRIHLDPVPADNGPLLVVPGSHRLGKIRESKIDAVVRRCGSFACLAEVGDVWAYATPILHASGAANGDRRRVLQVDYTAAPLAAGLEWLGLDG